MAGLGHFFAMSTLRATLAVVGRGGPGEEFPSAASVEADMSRLANDPVPLPRPVVILGGYHAPPQVAWWVRAQLARLTSGRSSDFLTVSFPLETRIERAAEKAIRVAESRWQAERPLDVIGLSMGGIVARYAAIPSPQRLHPARLTSPASRRLSVARLFTFASPHQGSVRAQVVAPDHAASDLKPYAPFLKALNARPRDYELVCYSQAGDNLIAPEHAAPPGTRAIIGGPSRLMSHFTAAHNPWFLVDLARRLRGETPILTAC